ncbi:MAG: hypothetical protein ACU843_17915 [Gammaproteobacteria bacterium]
MELILHVGMHKTGSSSIQEYLSRHDSMDLDYLILDSPNASLQVNLGFASNFARRPEVKAQEYSLQQLEELKEGAREKLRNCIAQCSKQRVLLSAEDLCHLQLNDFEAFIQFVSPAFSRIRAVGYARNPRDYVESAFQEVLKRQSVSESLKFDLRFKEKFGKFEEVLGRESLQIWAFDPGRFPERCVVRHFCNELGLDIQHEPVLRVNESLSTQAIKLLYLYRQYYPISPCYPSRLLERLSRLTGDKFQLNDQMYNKHVRIRNEDRDWLCERVEGTENWVVSRDDDGIRSEAEMLQLEPWVIEWLEFEAGTAIGRDTDSNRAIADLIHNLDTLPVSPVQRV